MTEKKGESMPNVISIGDKFDRESGPSCSRNFQFAMVWFDHQFRSGAPDQSMQIGT